MKKVILLFLVVLAGMKMYSQSDKSGFIPVTTNSKSALYYYNEGMKYFDDIKLNDAIDDFKKAINQDHDFFMANYQLAFYYILNRDRDDYNEYANAAINCKASLSEGEELLKEALVRLNQGNIDLTDIGRKLVDMYPNDPNSYSNMVSFQSLAGDSVGIVETLNKAIKIAKNPATFYNQLGYAYLTLNQGDKAEEAFDKYIELEPKNPNVYDSKGDYYMFMKKYDKAYESYKTANSIDSTFSREKAELARKLYEQTEGKKLEIISM